MQRDEACRTQGNDDLLLWWNLGRGSCGVSIWLCSWNSSRPFWLVSASLLGSKEASEMLGCFVQQLRRLWKVRLTEFFWTWKKIYKWRLLHRQAINVPWKKLWFSFSSIWVAWNVLSFALYLLECHFSSVGAKGIELAYVSLEWHSSNCSQNECIFLVNQSLNFRQIWRPDLGGQPWVLSFVWILVESDLFQNRTNSLLV